MEVMTVMKVMKVMKVAEHRSLNVRRATSSLGMKSAFTTAITYITVITFITCS